MGKSKVKKSEETIEKVRRKTKIICTLGPSSNDEATIEEMVKAGMNVARINCSHSSIADSTNLITKVKRVREKLDAPVGIIVDLAGPELRIGSFKHNTVVLREGEQFTLCCHNTRSSNRRVDVNYSDLYKDVKKGDEILLSDGLIILKVNLATP